MKTDGAAEGIEPVASTLRKGALPAFSDEGTSRGVGRNDKRESRHLLAIHSVATKHEQTDYFVCRFGMSSFR